MRLKAAGLGRSAWVVGAFALVAMLLVLPGSASPASASVIVTNGSFESGTAGWTVDVPVDVVCDPSLGWQAASGVCLVDMGATPSQGQIHQDIPTVSGHAYTLNFSLAGNPQCNATSTSKTLFVTASGNPTQTYNFDTTGHTQTSMGWTPETYAFTAMGSSTTLTLENGSSQTCGAAIDALSITDNDLAIATNPDVTTPQTSAAGAVVTYSPPVVTNGVPVTPVCAPASGSTFPVGTSVVTCTAVDPGDVSSPAISTFNVTVTALPTQHLSILGAAGSFQQPDANTDWSQDPVAWNANVYANYIQYQHDPGPNAWHFTGNPTQWHPAYDATRADGTAHDWGLIPGTSYWLNCGPLLNSDECGSVNGNVVEFRTRFTIPDGSIDPNITLYINSDNAGTYYLNGVQITDRLVGGGGGQKDTAVQPSGCSSGSVYCPAGVYPAALQSAIHTGVNELEVVVEDWGGLAGFNYRADLTVLGNTAPSQIPAITPTTTQLSFGTAPFVYNDSPFTATAAVSPAAAGTATVTYSGDCTNVGSTCTATATYAGNDTYAPSTATASITIAPAAVTATAGGGTSVYDATTHAPAACVVTGAYTGDLTCSNDHTSVGPQAGYTVILAVVSGTGLANFTVTSVPNVYTITRQPVRVTAGSGSSTYDGTMHAPSDCTIEATAGDISTVDFVCANDPATVGPDAGTTTITPSVSLAPNSAPGANWNVTRVNGSYTIDPAPTTTMVTFGTAPFVFNGSAFTATATVDPAAAGTATIAYTGDCVNPGDTCTATATFAATNNFVGSQASATITIVPEYYVCSSNKDDAHRGDDHGHALPSHEQDGGGHDAARRESAGHEAGSAVVVKVDVCDINGHDVSSRSLQVAAVGLSPTGTLNDEGHANRGNVFRYTDGVYTYNLDTKGLAPGDYTLDFTIGNDPTVQHYAFTINAAPLHLHGPHGAPAQVGQAYSSSLSATGGVGPYTYSVVGGALPDGLSLDPATGAITGTPTAGGVFHAQVQVTDGQSPAATDATNVTIEVKAATSGHGDHESGSGHGGGGHH